ncbi:DUF6303 family protein [Streptomyces enissocaesilis]|uniref:Uncharacterized protein n=1 Tax=Streptomyces enissocaesilis TaxID=332589 RepID=A0ABN3WYV3_9ACTN
MSAPFTAQVSRSCCDGNGSTTGAHWKLYVPTLGPVSTWPTYRWEGQHRRHVIPSPAEREQALAELGYQVAPGAEWRWIEDEGPDYHGHAPQVLLIGAIDVTPLTEAAAS